MPGGLTRGSLQPGWLQSRPHGWVHADPGGAHPVAGAGCALSGKARKAIPDTTQ